MKGISIFLRPLISPLVALSLATASCTCLLMILGESPSLLFDAFSNTLFTSFGLGYTLFYCTPLIFTGLSVAISFHCGLFNIGAEGQLYIGSLAIIFFSYFFPGVGSQVAIILAIVFSILAGSFWGAIAGWLKAKRNCHEVIVTILLNFIGISWVDYCILYVLKNPQTQNPETIHLPAAYHLPRLESLFAPLGWFAATPANFSLFIAVLVALGTYVFLFHTVYGFELRCVGENPNASRFAGISVTHSTVLALSLSGAVAALVGINEVMGYDHKLVQGFSPQYGFTGIAVALVARNHPIGILISAFLFGALHNSSRELEFLSDRVSKELSQVLQAILIIFIAAEACLEKFLYNRKKIS